MEYSKMVTAIYPTRKENYSEWYQQVIIAGELAENSPVRGCMVIRPWGYGVWEAIQRDLDSRLKATGHENAYFPLLIPLSYLEAEAEHVEGFAKECAVVTHHKLVHDEVNGGLKPAGELEEPLVIRPTSETIIGAMYARWVKSYRDLPVLINQWANVVRWEMRTRMFLRTSEFLWQEGHTVHATEEEAMEETLMILDLYHKFVEEVLAIPVIKGEKPCFERFPGAVNTYTIEAMMQDCKALQAGTSHFLGQNFAKSSKIQFLDRDGQQKYAWTTSWGVSTRMVGGLIMTHSDDNGFVVPPKIAPLHAVILPIYHNEDEKAQVLAFCENLREQLSNKVYDRNFLRVSVDDRDIRGGEKAWGWIKKGVPVRIEVGPRDIKKKSLCIYRRDMEVKQKEFIDVDEFIIKMPMILDSIQNVLFNRALEFREKHITYISSLDEFNDFFSTDLNQEKGFACCYAVDDIVIENHLKPLKVTARCMFLERELVGGECIFTGEKVTRKMIFAKAY